MSSLRAFKADLSVTNTFLGEGGGTEASRPNLCFKFPILNKEDGACVSVCRACGGSDVSGLELRVEARFQSAHAFKKHPPRACCVQVLYF